jgi:predicted nuclease of predicted toxin-antitoxin system
MANKIKFHLDENVSNAIAQGLRSRDIDVTTVPEVGLIGVGDEQQVIFARSQQRVIFTFDDDFLRLASQGIDHAGIIYTRQQNHSIGKIISDLTLIWECLESEYMDNKVEFL